MYFSRNFFFPSLLKTKLLFGFNFQYPNLTWPKYYFLTWYFYIPWNSIFNWNINYIVFHINSLKCGMVSFIELTRDKHTTRPIRLQFLDRKWFSFSFSVVNVHGKKTLKRRWTSAKWFQRPVAFLCSSLKKTLEFLRYYFWNLVLHS